MLRNAALLASSLVAAWLVVRSRLQLSIYSSGTATAVINSTADMATIQSTYFRFIS